MKKVTALVITVYLATNVRPTKHGNSSKNIGKRKKALDKSARVCYNKYVIKGQELQQKGTVNYEKV